MKNLIILIFVFLVFNACNKTETVLPNTRAAINVETQNAQTALKPFKFTFEEDRENWNFDGDVNGYYSLTAGNPGGCIYGVDQSLGIYWYFTAPDALITKIRSLNAYNHILKFDLKAPANGTNEPDVIIESNKLKLVYNTPQDPNDITWTTYRVPFNDLSGWRKESLTGQLASKSDIRDVLQNLKKLSIRGEYFVGSDTGYLDNVTYD